MKKIVLFFSLLLMFAFTPPNGPETPISIDIHAASFSDFCKLVYEKTQVKIFYKDADVQKIAVSLSVNAMPLVDVVKMAIAGTELKVSVWNNQLVILNSESLVTDFPELIPEGSVHESKETSNYMEVRRADSRTVIKVGKQDRSKRNQLVNLKCKVLEAENDLPIIGATLYVTETQTGAISDIDGVVNFAIRAGKYNITIAFLGLETKKCQLIAYDNGSFEVSLRKASIDIGEVNVFADKQSSIVTRDPGMERITAKSVRELPTMIGERDILKISESLPGIVSVGEGASGVNVRGGNSDQNAFYLNGIPIYNTSHLFGFFPAINAEIVKDFSIFKGFIPLQYGGRLSSVFNVSTKPGNNKQFYAKGGITPITANLILETPIIKDKASLQLSMRSSFSDWVLKKIKAGAYSDSKSQFYDGSFAVNFDAGKTQNALFVYRSSDRFKYSTLTDYQYATTGVSFISKYSITDNIHNRISLIGSSYGFETSEMSNASTAFTHNYAINSLELKDDVSHFISENLQLEYGANIVFNAINRGKVKPYNEESFLMPYTIGKEYGLEYALYAATTYKPIPQLTLAGGVRLGAFSAMGPQTVTKYLEGTPLDKIYITGTEDFGSGKIIKSYFEPDFRASAAYETDAKGSVKLAFSQTHQNMFMLNNSVSISPNSQWKMADYYIEPAESKQYSLGMFRTLSKLKLEVSAEVFYKNTQKYSEFIDGADFLNSNTEQVVLQGQQEAYGVELMLKLNRTKLNGWISYTYSHTKVKIDGANDWQKINNGDAFNSNYDIPNVLNSVLNWRISKRIVLTSLVSYQSGKPITAPISVYYLGGVPYIKYSDRNAYRIPDYFRMDLSLTVEGNLRQKKFLHSSWMFSVYNLTGRKNPYSVYFNNEDGHINAYKYSVIGTPIFTVSWIFKLGNYLAE